MTPAISRISSALGERIDMRWPLNHAKPTDEQPASVFEQTDRPLTVEMSDWRGLQFGLHYQNGPQVRRRRGVDSPN
jgi:hypothetical protein